MGSPPFLFGLLVHLALCPSVMGQGTPLHHTAEAAAQTFTQIAEIYNEKN